MKGLADAASAYLALRRTLGFKLYHETWWLPDFVSYLEQQGSTFITTELAVSWAQQPPYGDPNWWAKRLGAIRRFAQHYRAFDPRTEVPPAAILPYRSRRLTPHLYTDAEIAALVHAATALPHPFRSATYVTLIGLLAATGMRVGEAIQLERAEVDTDRAVLTVRDSKFGKSRHVPVHPTTAKALVAYGRVRDRHSRQPRSPTFFISCAGTKLLEQNVWYVFARLRRQAGLLKPGQRPPRIHDLRHTFALNTLLDWYRRGVDVERRLPWLSTYLGHVSPTTTYWYLTATPELLALASRRAQRAWGVRS